MLKFSITPRSQSHRQKWNSVQILIFVSFITRNKFLGFSIACFSLFIKQTDSTKPKECQVTEAMESTCHLARESKLLLLLIIAHGNHPGVDSGEDCTECGRDPEDLLALPQLMLTGTSEEMYLKPLWETWPGQPTSHTPS